MSETRHRLRDALGVVVASALLMLALEGGARLLGISEPERPKLPDKPPATFRILALGGSTVLGVPDGSQGFVAQLERGLRRAAPGRPLEVLNLARSGASSAAVRAMLESAIEAEPDLLIVLMGHNEFLAPPAGPLQRLRNGSRIASLVSRLLPDDDVMEDPFPETLIPVDRASDAFRSASEGFRENLNAVVRLAGEAGVPLFLCTAPANLADWPPAHRRVARPAERPDDAERVEALWAQLAAGEFEAAAEAATGALAGQPETPLLLYLEGRALRGLGRADAARDRFERARDLDPIPRRAFGSFNGKVGAHAGQPGVWVVDIAQRFEDYAEAGLVGFDLVCDNCHPTPKGNAIIARELAVAMAEAGIFLQRGARIAPLDAWQARLAAAGGNATEQQRRQVRWLLSNAIYSMKTPFFNYEASRRYLEQARALAPNDWRIFANLASLDLLTGNLTAGRQALRRATALRGAPLDPEDRRVTPYLKEALAHAGIAAPLPPADRDRDAGGS